MSLEFDWDKANRKHIARHLVSTDEAEQAVNNDPLDLEMQTESGEERLVQLGETDKHRILLVVTTWRNSKVRVITAFDAPKQLRDFYLISHS